jgi:hypothetical protein
MTRTTGALTAIAVVLAVAAPSAARAGDADRRRRVAVLEYRSGSAALPGIDGRIAQLLRGATSLGVVDADEARKAYGSGLDADVVDCAGDEICIAGIGTKLGADEVLLVGISEFGDVILTLQRIDVPRRRVATRIAEALAEDAAPTDPELTGYLRRVMPDSDFLQYGTIRVSANLAGAEVYVGRERRGRTPIEALRVLAPATYELRLVKKGYVPFEAKVAVPPEGEVEVDARLTREGAGGRWYARWWVAALAGVVVAGGIGVGVWIAQDPPTSVRVDGMID